MGLVDELQVALVHPGGGVEVLCLVLAKQLAMRHLAQLVVDQRYQPVHHLPRVLEISPLAEDVHGAFGVGRDDKHLSPADTSGLALAAIQGMDARLDRELDDLRARNAGLAAENRLLHQRLEAIEKLIVPSLATP